MSDQPTHDPPPEHQDAIYPLAPGSPAPQAPETDSSSDNSDGPMAGSDPWREPVERYQFTLRQLLLFTAAFALGLGMLRYLGITEPGPVAGVVGLVALVFAGIRSFCESTRGAGQLVLWFLLAFYVVACITAILRN